MEGDWKEMTDIIVRSAKHPRAYVKTRLTEDSKFDIMLEIIVSTS
jgi:hypothetical protein